MKRVAFYALAAGVVGLLVWAITLAVDPARALVGWLAAYTWGLNLALGALILVLVCDLAGATWFVVLRPVATSIAATLPLFAVLFIPMIVGMRILYPWAWPASALAEGELEKVEQVRQWIRPGWFVLRAIVYLGVWSALAVLARRSNHVDSRRRIAAVGVPIVGLTSTFAAFEWIMSLEIGWGSTIFGLYFGVGSYLAGASLVAVLAWLERRNQVLPPEVKPDHFHALGRLVLVGVALWAYCAFSQLLIIWLANVPREVSFYIERSRGAWDATNWILVLGHFVVPFFALLVRELKRRPPLLAATAAWIVVMRVVDAAWLVLPARASGPALADLAALVAVGGLATALGLRIFAGSEAVPRQDPGWSAALRYESS